MLRTVQNLVLAFAAGGTGIAVDAVEAVVLGDSVGVVQGRLPRGVGGGGAVVLRALDRSRSRMRRTVPDNRIAGRILDPGGDDHRSSRVHALPGRRAAHDGAALLQLAGRAIIVLLAARRWLVFRRQHVRQHRPFFLHLVTRRQTRIRKFSYDTARRKLGVINRAARRREKYEATQKRSVEGCRRRIEKVYRSR